MSGDARFVSGAVSRTRDERAHSHYASKKKTIVCTCPVPFLLSLRQA